MAKATNKVDGVSSALEIEPLRVGTMTLWIKGTTPIICNRMAGKAMRELLFPKGRATTAEKQQRLKHDPVSEFRNSMRLRGSDDGPTRIQFPAPAVKGAIATAALETRGATKAQIGRLVQVKGYSLDLYGVPKLFMSVVRSADMNKTPDIRTRAIIEEWCMPVTIQHVRPQLNETNIAQLLSNGGVIIGIGDFRSEKGKSDFGSFEISTKEECEEIVKSGGMKQQDEAIKTPVCFDRESEELLSWFKEEVQRRGKHGQLDAAA